MFDPAQYIAMKPCITGIVKEGDTITVTKKAYDPDTGEKTTDELTLVSLSELQAQMTAFQDFINNAQQFLNDAQ